MLDSTYSNENDMLTANPCLKQISNLMVYLVKALELGIAKQIFRAHVITYFHHISDFRFFEPVLNRIFRSFGIYLEKRIFFNVLGVLWSKIGHFLQIEKITPKNNIFIDF